MELTLGVTAHVDAGKTTLCEQLLLRAGVIRSAGRVDHGDAFMDANDLERARGITIFCEQATIELAGEEGERVRVTLMDTPGHVDFSGETARAMSALDAALLVVSCAEGVQSHTATLFGMLREQRVPTLIFLNKTDREGADVARVAAQLKRLLSDDCVLMTQERDALCEELAARDEALMEAYLDGRAAREDYLAGARRAFAAGALFPVLSGSALLGRGIDALEQAIAALCRTDYAARERAPFRALCYRVRRAEGARCAYVKIESGSIAVRDEVRTLRGAEKVSAIYAAQGGRLTPVQRASAGQTAVIAGLGAKIGERMGEECGMITPPLVPLQSVAVLPRPPLDLSKLLGHLRELEDEDPLLRVRARPGEVSVGVMGAVQIEVLGSLLLSRFGDAVDFAPPRVLYKETVATPVVGIGHYEPLRHYAECWLRLSPGEPGSGVTFEAACPPNSLDVNWQRLIRQHVMEREHPGVLTGSPITDVRVTLLAGRSHLKHTEGGDFREATYRAIRNALMHAQSVLLEPLVRFELAFASDALSRVTGELIRMGAQLDAPEVGEEETRLCGACTAAAFWDYPERFAATTRGHGRIASRFWRYAPCKNQQEIVERSGYLPLADEANPPGSVFCSHGAGFYVAWDHVREWAHCEVEGA